MIKVITLIGLIIGLLLLSSCTNNNPDIEQLKEDIAQLKISKERGETIIILSEVAKTMELMMGNNTKEYGLCLTGGLGSENNVILNGSYTMQHTSDGKDLKSDEFCTQVNTMAFVHSHPGGRCELSMGDKTFLSVNKNLKQVPLFIVHCRKDEYKIFGRDDFDKPYQLEIMEE